MVLIAEVVTSTDEMRDLGPDWNRHFKPLPDTEFEPLQKIFERCPAVRACFETKLRFIHGGGVIVEKAGSKLSDDDTTRFNTTWLSFSKDYQASRTCFGIVFVAVNSRNEPVVIWPTQVHVSVRYLDGRRTYYLRPRDGSGVRFARPGRLPKRKVLDGGMHEERKSTGKRKGTPSEGTGGEVDYMRSALSDDGGLDSIIDDLPLGWVDEEHGLRYPRVFEESAPSADCKLSSAIKSLLQIEGLKNVLIRLTVEADHRRSNPSVFLQSTKQTPAGIINQRDVNLYGDRNAHAMKQRLMDEMDVMRMMGSHEEQVVQLRAQGQGSEGDMISGTDPVTGNPRYPVHRSAMPGHTNSIPLPDDRQLVIGPMAEAPADVYEMLAWQKMEVGMVMGVPSELWGNHRTAVAVNNNQMELLVATQRAECSTMCLVFEKMIAICYGESEAHEITSIFRASNRIARRRGQSSKSLEQTVDEHRVRVSFPGLIGPEIIYSLADRGAMNEAVQCKYLAKFYGLLEGDLDPKRMREERDIMLKSQELGVAQQRQHMDVQAETLKMQYQQQKFDMELASKQAQKKSESKGKKSESGGGGPGGAGGGGGGSGPRLPVKQPGPAKVITKKAPPKKVKLTPGR